jgi:hypothetical protein
MHACGSDPVRKALIKALRDPWPQEIRPIRRPASGDLIRRHQVVTLTSHLTQCISGHQQGLACWLVGLLAWALQLYDRGWASVGSYSQYFTCGGSLPARLLPAAAV